MGTMTITTNGHARELRALYELPESARADFDYVGPCEESNDAAWDRRFFDYRGAWYDVRDGFDRTTSDELRAWDGFQSDSCFSGIAIRYPLEWDGTTVDYDAVVVARVTW